eukprot:scaffold132000_cov38-Prasinocladus_malaysianus.AAC.1
MTGNRTGRSRASYVDPHMKDRKDSSSAACTTWHFVSDDGVVGHKSKRRDQISTWLGAGERQSLHQALAWSKSTSPHRHHLTGAGRQTVQSDI